jgi:hypothetical protein
MNPTEDLVTTEVTTTGVLRAAARYISVYGWNQGGMFAEDGDLYPPACAMGAIRFAVTGDALPFDEDALDDGRSDIYVNAVDALCGYLLNTGAIRLTDDMFEPFDVVAEWNDDRTRNVSQVLAALTGASRDWDWDRTRLGGAR